MNHSFIKEHNIIARYWLGKLSSDESARFEEHFVDCPECQGQLETTADFNQGLRTVLAKEAARPHLPAPFPWLAWLAPASTWRFRLVAAAIGVVLFAVPTVVLLKDMRLARTELNQLRLAADDWRRRYEESRQTNAALVERFQETERKAQEKPAASGNSGEPMRLPALASIFVLNTTRAGDLGNSEPANQVVISRSPQWVVFSVDREEVQDLRSYRATLRDSRSRVLWKESLLPPGPLSTLGISVPSGIFREGDYLLTVEGLSQNGGRVLSRSYPFRLQFTK